MRRLLYFLLGASVFLCGSFSLGIAANDGGWRFLVITPLALITMVFGGMLLLVVGYGKMNVNDWD